MAVMEHVFSDKMAAMVTALDTDAPPLERFEQFIRRFVELMGNDNNLRVLLQRELLDGDEVRLKFLAERLFVAPFEAVTSLAKSVSSKTDPYMLAISVVGLVLFHFETATLRNFLPGGDDKRNNYDNITEHVTQLLQMALGGGATR